MKRYLVFAWRKYNQAGGWDDFVDDFDEITQVFELAKEMKKEVDCYQKPNVVQIYKQGGVPLELDLDSWNGDVNNIPLYHYEEEEDFHFTGGTIKKGAIG